MEEFVLCGDMRSKSDEQKRKYGVDQLVLATAVLLCWHGVVSGAQWPKAREQRFLALCEVCCSSGTRRSKSQEVSVGRQCCEGLSRVLHPPLPFMHL